MAFDEASVMPAAVAICSMYRSCSSPQSIRLGIIDLGLQGESRARIQQLALGTIDWLSTEQATIHRGGTKHPRVSCCSSSDPPIPAHTWIKLGLGAAASHRTERALYLDADVLVRGDVCELWESTKGMKVAVCAVPDFGHPRGHAGLPADTWDPHLCAYFNAGGCLLWCLERPALPHLQSPSISAWCADPVRRVYTLSRPSTAKPSILRKSSFRAGESSRWINLMWSIATPTAPVLKCAACHLALIILLWAGVFVLDIAAFQSQEPRLSSLAASRSWKYDDQESMCVCDWLFRLPDHEGKMKVSSHKLNLSAHDVLNMGFAKRWLPLDPAWNAQVFTHKLANQYCIQRAGGTGCTSQPRIALCRVKWFNVLCCSRAFSDHVGPGQLCRIPHNSKC
eukprot:1159900-Pelagomonas_calceolata.AAC.2